MSVFYMVPPEQHAQPSGIANHSRRALMPAGILLQISYLAVVDPPVPKVACVRIGSTTSSSV